MSEDQAPVQLARLYSVYKQTAAAATSTATTAPSASSKAAKKNLEKEDEDETVVIDKEKAEKLKSEGNKLLAAKEFNMVCMLARRTLSRNEAINQSLHPPSFLRINMWLSYSSPINSFKLSLKIFFHVRQLTSILKLLLQILPMLYTTATELQPTLNW